MSSIFNPICVCDSYSYYSHEEDCPYGYRSDISFLNETITIEVCTKCSVLVYDFEAHWKAVHEITDEQAN